MKINISSKNYPMSDKLESYIQKKLEKIGKFFDRNLRLPSTPSRLCSELRWQTTAYMTLSTWLQINLQIS